MCTYELVSVLVACQSDFLNELIDILARHGRTLRDDFDIVFAGESLTICHLNLLVVRIQFVPSHSHDALLRRRLFQLLDPGFCSLHTLSASRIIYDKGRVSISQVHAVEDHVALLPRQVIDFQRDVRAERLDFDRQVLLGD